MFASVISVRCSITYREDLLSSEGLMTAQLDKDLDAEVILCIDSWESNFHWLHVWHSSLTFVFFVINRAAKGRSKLRLIASSSCWYTHIYNELF